MRFTEHVNKLGRNMLTSWIIYSSLFVMLQVRHDNKDQLEKLKDTVVLIEQKLSPAITLETHSSRLASMKSGGKFSSCTREPGACCPVYISPLADDK